jgi:hypothetical protein
MSFTCGLDCIQGTAFENLCFALLCFAWHADTFGLIITTIASSQLRSVYVVSFSLYFKEDYSHLRLIHMLDISGRSRLNRISTFRLYATLRVHPDPNPDANICAHIAAP